MNENELQDIKYPYCAHCGDRMELDWDSYEPDTGLWHYYRCPNCGHSKEID